jgi:phytoene dehydrogenase-like protein
LTSDEIIKLEEIKDKNVGRFILKSGGEVAADECIFTVSPGVVAELLPEEYFPPAFFKRIRSFDYTPGFFTVFGELDQSVKPENNDSIVSLYPETDIDALARPGRGDKPGALAILHSVSNSRQVLTAFEPVYWEVLSKWGNSSIQNRSDDYYRWKDAKTQQMMSRIYHYYPQYRNKISIITAGTPLTYRDYLNHTQGAAYGIRQKIEQYNLIGQLRLRNLYCAGQSAILPGVLGTIMASMLVARNIIGIDMFKKLTNS